MMKKLPRREVLRLMAISAAAALISCQKNEPLSGNSETIETPVLQSLTTPTETPKKTIPPTPEPTATTPAEIVEATATQRMNTMPIVYMTADISADGLMRIYEALNHKAHGNVAVKISSGEPGGHHFLSPDLI